MSKVPKNLLYTEEHEWILVEDGRGTIGITDHAQEALGDVVYVDLPAVGDKIVKGETFGTVESVKAASDIYAPVSGTVVEVNEALKENPELINRSPYEDAWMVVVELDDENELDELLSPEDYKNILEGE